MSKARLLEYLSLSEAIDKIARWHFSGDKEKALKNVLNELMHGTLTTEGLHWDATTDFDGVGFDAQKRASMASDPEPITPEQWRGFDYDADENNLFYRVADFVADMHHEAGVENIEVERAACCKIWPPPAININDVIWAEVIQMKQRGEALEPKTQLARQLVRFLWLTHWMQLSDSRIRNILMEIWEPKDLA